MTKETFSTGAQRDTQDEKPRIDLISPYFLRRLGSLLAKGAEHYGERNWEMGMPFSRVIASLCRHVESIKAGDTDEDHISAAAFNLMALAHYQEQIDQGCLPVDLDDVSFYDRLEFQQLIDLSKE